MSEETLFELIGGPEDGQRVMLSDVGDCQYLFVESVSLLNVSFEEDQPCPRFTKLKFR